MNKEVGNKGERQKILSSSYYHRPLYRTVVSFLDHATLTQTSSVKTTFYLSNAIHAADGQDVSVQDI